MSNIEFEIDNDCNHAQFNVLLDCGSGDIISIGYLVNNQN